MKNERHSPTPWRVEENGIWTEIYDIDDEPVDIDRDIDNATRIVACVNACDGISNEQLAQGIKKTLWVNWNAATGVPYISDFCESELASEPLTAAWVNRMAIERYAVLEAAKRALHFVKNIKSSNGIACAKALSDAINKAGGGQS